MPDWLVVLLIAVLALMALPDWLALIVIAGALFGYMVKKTTVT